METKTKTSRLGKKAKVWSYTYTFDTHFVGLMTKTDFIAEINLTTGDSIHFIRGRICETFNTEDIAAANRIPGQIAKVSS